MSCRYHVHTTVETTAGPVTFAGAGRTYGKAVGAMLAEARTQARELELAPSVARRLFAFVTAQHQVTTEVRRP